MNGTLNLREERFGTRLGGTWSIVELLVVIAIIGLLMALTLSARADNTQPYAFAPQQPNFYRLDSAAFPCVLTNGGSLVFPAGGTNSLKLPVRQDKGLSFFVRMGTTNPSTGSATLKWDLTPDGTNYTTSQPLQWVITPGNSTTNGLWWTNIPPAVLNNVRAIQLTGFSNNFTNWWWGTNLWYSYSGQ